MKSVLCIVAAIFFLKDTALLAQSGEQLPKLRILALPFENSTGSEKFSELALNLGDLLGLDLARYGGIALVDREEIRSRLREFELSARGLTTSKFQLGKILGANRVLSGGVSFINAALQLNVHVYEVETTKLVASLETRTTVNELGDAVKSLSKNLAGQLLRKTDIEQLAGSERPLAEYYFVRGLGNFLSESFDQAIAEFAHALAIDAGFENARFWLAKSYCAGKLFKHGEIELRRYMQEFPQGARIKEVEELREHCKD